MTKVKEKKETHTDTQRDRRDTQTTWCKYKNLNNIINSDKNKN